MNPMRHGYVWVACILAAALMSAESGAAALYKWTDASGRIVYSDQPPPGNVKSEILKGPPPPANPNAMKEMATKELEYRQRQLDKAEAGAKADKDQATAKERAERIDELERELQILRERAEQTDRANRELQAFREGVGQANKVERELQTLRETVEHQTDKLRGELQQARSEIERLTLERDFYSKRALALEQHNREVTEAATKYSLWGQRLERELAKIDPDGARARQFGAWSASQVSALEPPLRGAA